MTQLLQLFWDVMFVKLLKKLPPKRKVDHKIELMRNTESLARALYRMSLLELE